MAQLTADTTIAGAILGALLGFVRGAVEDELGELEAQRRTGISEEAWRAELAPYIRSVIEGDRYPHVAEVVISGEDLDYDQQFEFGLARLIDGIEAFIGELPVDAA